MVNRGMKVTKTPKHASYQGLLKVSRGYKNMARHDSKTGEHICVLKRRMIKAKTKALNLF